MSAWDIGWILQYGNGNVVSSLDLRTDATGLYVVGATFPALPGQTLIGGTTDTYVRKVGFDGSVLWTREFGTLGLDFGVGLATDATGVYTVGQTTGAFAGYVNSGVRDVFLRKYDANGNELWTRQFGTSRTDFPFIHGIAVRSGEVYVAGKTSGTFPGSPAGEGEDVFLAKLDAITGTLIWVRQFGVRGLPFQSGGVTVDETGVFVSGGLQLGPDFKDPVIGMLRKYDFAGSLIWERQLPGTLGCAVAIWGLSAYNGAVYLAGQANGAFVDGTCSPPRSSVVGLLRKYNTQGNLIWSRRIQGGSLAGQDGFTGAKHVFATSSGVYVGANLTTSFPAQLPDVPRFDRSRCPGLAPGNAFADKLDGYIRRYDFDGNVIWTHEFGSGVFELVTGAGTNGTHVYLAGDTSCNVQDDTLFSGGNRDVFLLQLAIEPTSVQGKIQLLVGQLETLRDKERLGVGSFTALIARVESTQAALAVADISRARQGLTQFIDDVQGLISVGELTAAEGTPLISSATALLALI